MPRLLPLALLALASITAACRTTTPIDATEPATAVACQAFAPITWSGDDTAATIRQVREHNAAWGAVCD